MPKSKSLKIVVDTNLWISFIISKKLGAFEKLLIEHKVKILFSTELIEELKATFQKPKLKKYFGENALEEMLEVFDSYIELVSIKSKIKICRDPKDNFLLELAKDGKADFLVTGDKDLLEIQKYGKFQILNLTSFQNKTYTKGS